jgi:hypothetical protein
VPDTEGSDVAREALRRLALDVVGELEALHVRLIRLDRLVEALLGEDDGTLLDEPTRRELRRLRRVATAYTRAYDDAQR